MSLTRIGGLGMAGAASLALIAATFAPVAAQASESKGDSAPAVTYYTGTPGVARLLPRSTPAPAPSGPARVGPIGAQRLPSRAFSAMEAVPGARGPAAPTAAPSSPLVNFNGVSSRDSQFTNYNEEFEPPDQGLCEGNGVVLEVINRVYSFYSTSGKLLRGPFNLNDLFNVGGKEYTSDPRCWYDAATTTWFATILFLNDKLTASSLLIAVRHAASPLDLWNTYAINTTDEGNGCPCFGDQPRIGVDQDNLYVTADEYSIGVFSNTVPQPLGAEMWAFDKAQLIRGSARLNFVRFNHLQLAGHPTLAPQPALSTGKPDAEFFLSSLDFSGNGDHRIGVWAMTRRSEVAAGGIPVLSSMVITSEAYADPPFAPQQGTSSQLDPDDDRMQQTEFVGSTIWGELTTAVKPPGDTKVRAGGAWFQVKPSAGQAGITGASIVRQGYIAAKGEYELYPAVQPDAAGNALAVFTVSSGEMFPSAGYAALKAGARNFGPTVVAALGTGRYDPNSSRWGDYSFAVPDDTSDSAWLATEYIPPKSSQTTNGVSNWGTRVFEVPLG